MTAEICLMNRFGAVLAADSAVTTTQGVGEDRRERYYKGANKIFQLSDRQPVAVMLHGGAAFHAVPWEILIKEFRNILGSGAYPALKDYAHRFFDFLRTHPLSAGAELIGDATENALSAATRMVIELADTSDEVKAADVLSEKRAAFDGVVRELIAARDADGLPDFITDAEATQGIADYTSLANQIAQEFISAWRITEYADPDLIATAALQITLKRYDLVGSQTGLVFAGFGTEEYFPNFIQFRVYGLVYGKLATSEQTYGAVSRKNAAWIQPFALSSMIETFSFGLSTTMTSSLKSELTDVLGEFVSALEGAGAVMPADIDALKAAMVNSFGDRTFDRAWKENGVPLRQVIGSLSMGELAELAETLISLESIKERMTRPSESVSGPVDVAVITRNEGFVWVKRKHYFNPALNPRYLQRQAQATGSNS